MEIILLQDIEKVGGKHELVTVKNGYGRNFLIPQKLAIIANSSNKRRLKELKRMESALVQKGLDEMNVIVDKLKGTLLKIVAKAGTSGKIFGSVTNVQISQALKDQFGVEVEKAKVEMTEEVKMLGTYSAVLNLHKEVKTTISFEVVQD